MYRIVDLGSHPEMSIDYLFRSQGGGDIEIRVGAISYHLSKLDVFMLREQMGVELIELNNS